MKTTIAALAAAATVTCLAASPPAEPPEANPLFIYATYYQCNTGTMYKSEDEVVKLYKKVLDGMIARNTLTSWGWLVRNTGGEWTRAEYFSGPSVAAVVGASTTMQPPIDHPPPKNAFDEACGSGEDYIWHMLAGNDGRTHRGAAAFSIYYVCDQSREKQADALVKRAFAPMYDKLVADGKLTSWGWAEHIVGGKYRRLATLTAPTVDALIAAREGIVAATEHDPLNDAFIAICGSHQDYIWDVREQGP